MQKKIDERFLEYSIRTGHKILRHDLIPDLKIKSKIKARMKEKGMSIKELAEETGLSYETIRSILEGLTKEPRLYTMVLLSIALECSIDDLFEVEMPN